MNIASRLSSLIVTPIHSFFSEIGTDLAENGVVGEGQMHASVRIVYAHGIRTSESQCLQEAQSISRIFANTQVHYTYYRSSGSLGDLRRMAHVMYRQVPLVAAKKLAENIRERIHELDQCLPTNKERRVVVIVHSGGGLLMKIACLYFLQAQERKKITIYTFGSAYLFSQDLVGHAVNYVSRSDYVPSICTIFQGYFWNKPGPMVLLGSCWKSPITAHAIAGCDYMKGLTLAKNDLEEQMRPVETGYFLRPREKMSKAVCSFKACDG